METDTVKESRGVLCVDLDGTLIKSDLLVESVLALVKQNPFFIFLLPLWLLKGKARLKHEIAMRTVVDVVTLPYHQEFSEYLHRQKANGKSLILASASNIRLVQDVADHLGMFDNVIASDRTVNCSGIRKLEAIRKLLDNRAFDYAGNSMDDLPIWKEAEAAVVVNPESGVLERVRRLGSSMELIDNRSANRFGDYLRALRPHQWLKNLLVFVPLLMAHKIQEGNLLFDAMLAFVVFCLCASSVYILNDMLDLPDDRRHQTKRERPFASGDVSIVHGILMAPLLLVLAIGTAAFLPPEFVSALAVYYVCTLFYSFRLKLVPILDVLVLAGLYTIRIIAGGMATAVDLSFWLLAFSMFLFLSLALVKRYVELNSLLRSGNDAVSGRGYRSDDIEIFGLFGTGSGYMAVLVLALYVNSSAVSNLYTHPEVIWLLCPILLYLIMRVWLLARRGQLNEDPVVFFIEDRVSQLLCVAALVLLWLAG